MAINLWGKVYYKDTFAGILRQEPDGRYRFTYDETYLQSTLPDISYSLPLQAEPHLGDHGLHPFFDNLCAEGWLKNAQTRALGRKGKDRFALLLAFGSDLAGAVSIRDPNPTGELILDHVDLKSIAALASRASLSGVQPKLGAIKEGNEFRSPQRGERARYIAKLPSNILPDILELEYITMRACETLLPNDMIVKTALAPLRDVSETALLIERFDRTEDGDLIHFEEFNQLLGHLSDNKYDACYEDMARFIRDNSNICMQAECDTLFRRIMACILVGNTDAHLKNFAMQHTDNGLRLAPCYDLVATACYPQYQTLALGIGDSEQMLIGNIKPKHIVRLGNLFGLPNGAIMMAINDLANRLDRVYRTIDTSKNVNQLVKDKLQHQIRKRWNGTFNSIGTYLSKKR
ncbi:MAG: HipA domain-containing protein [Bacteroidetes bacterium]|nr:HipA domain-containing protein [Bacteroidota bacterium]